MPSAKKPDNEKQRLQALRSLNILDTLPEHDFDQITFLASQICETPIALISLVDQNRQWFKSAVGLKTSETSRDVAFCAHAILNEDVLVVPDSSRDDRFADNPLVTGPTNFQSYAGAPLISPDGYSIGTVCVFDSKPRHLEPRQIAALKALSGQVTRLLELRFKIEALRVSEEKLRFRNKAIETALEGILLQDADGKVVDFNPAALTVLGLAAEQLVGASSLDLTWHAIKENGSILEGRDHPPMICLRTAKPQINVIMGIRNENSKLETRWVKVNSAPLFHGSEEAPSHVVSTFADITEELLAKKTLEKKKADLSFVLDGIPHMVGLWGSDEINRQANAAYSAFFKKDPEQIKGRHLRELLGHERYEKNAPGIKRVLAGEKVSFEDQLPDKDGKVRHVLGTFVPNFKDHKVDSYLAIIVDITDLKKLQNDQRQLEARLAESAKLSALGEMAAGVAHEVNNPLAIIKGRAALLIRKANSQALDWDSAIKSLKTIETTADRIAKIVKALRTYSRDAENDALEEANLTEIVTDTLELCTERFSKANVKIRVQCEPSVKIRCRPAQISQVVMNLLNNSFDAISECEEKWIEIQVAKRSGSAILQVSDSGSGISKDIVEKIMNPFFTTKEVGKGTGLGLSISTGIIESLGGTLKYEADAPHTTFVVRIPEVIQSSTPKVA